MSLAANTNIDASDLVIERHGIQWRLRETPEGLEVLEARQRRPRVMIPRLVLAGWAHRATVRVGIYPQKLERDQIAIVVALRVAAALEEARTHRDQQKEDEE